ncbi:MAG: crossover junction endodeoxyribonuclease RuvC [Candidatus Nomurabacteria bacterium]|nr:MAG: crossover junction endodeoxyribonuclease RuvC [Candidatus Nomurabacteria bacterium]HRV76091.1 crossover junction endodeoxyribonuclease RuvC [Candidatus Saccharimonadales bacterium]
MKILGIDPGTGIVGFGVIEVKPGNKYHLLDAGVIKTPVNQELPERLETIYKELIDIIKLNNPEQISVEKLFFSQNVKTAISVSHARGVVLLVAQQHNLIIAEYTPQQIKQALTGYGKAKKDQVQAMVQTILQLKNPIKQDDCADAIAAAICHAMSIDNLNVASSL